MDARQVIKVNPKFAKGYFRLASVFNEMGLSAEAFRALEKAAALDPSNQEV